MSHCSRTSTAGNVYTVPSSPSFLAYNFMDPGWGPEFPTGGKKGRPAPRRQAFPLCPPPHGAGTEYSHLEN